MANRGDPTTGERPSFFPSTYWSLLRTVQGAITAEQQSALNWLIQRYWKPVYCYVCHRGFDREEAKDLVQEFFVSCLHKDLFGKADSGWLLSPNQASGTGAAGFAVSALAVATIVRLCKRRTWQQGCG